MTSSNNSYQPLNISIVGAGIGGLTAAIALRRNGHNVQVCLFTPWLIFSTNGVFIDIRNHGN
jgi:2-polyprenyl-6-methoxyphenol hydroxylase-like FAD-dependent oxidoreductase